MGFKVKEKHLECLFLVVFLGLFLWLGASNLFDHNLSHAFPYGYFASDAFLHQTTAQSIKNMDGYVNVIYYKAAGYEDVVAYDPPLSGFLSTTLSYLSSLEVYDTIYLLVFICLILTALLLYLLARDLDKHLALLILPFFLLIFSAGFYSGIIYGQWDFYYGTVFMVASIWALSKLELSGMYIIMGIFTGTAFLAHAVEGIWAAGFIGLWLIINAIRNKIVFPEIKKILFSGAISVLITSYFLLIFMKVWLPGRESRLFKWTTTVWGGYPIASIFDLNWMLVVLMILGIIFFFFWMKDKKNLLPWLGFYILGITYTNYIGFDKAFQTRFNLPLYLAFFLALGIFMLFKFAKVKINTLIAIGISVLLCLGFFFLFYQPTNAPGMMNPYYWEGLEFIKEKTPEKTAVFYFYHGYLNSRNAFENGERVTNTIDLEDYDQARSKGEIRREYNKITGRGKLYFKKTPWDWVDRNLLNNSEFEGPTDICKYQYYSFEIYDQKNQMSGVIQYNLALRKVFLAHPQFKEVFNNQVISILKNEKPGEECVN